MPDKTAIIAVTSGREALSLQSQSCQLRYATRSHCRWEHPCQQHEVHLHLTIHHPPGVDPQSLQTGSPSDCIPPEHCVETPFPLLNAEQVDQHYRSRALAVASDSTTSYSLRATQAFTHYPPHVPLHFRTFLSLLCTLTSVSTRTPLPNPGTRAYFTKAASTAASRGIRCSH